jgi:hypothetical protein
MHVLPGKFLAIYLSRMEAKTPLKIEMGKV